MIKHGLVSLAMALCSFMVQVAQAASIPLDDYPAYPSRDELVRLAGLYESARELERTRDYSAAANAMEELISANWPFETDVLSFKLGLARMYQRAELGDQAAELLESIENSTTRNHPLYPEIHFQLSMAILRGKDKQTGVERLEFLAHRYASSDAGQRALLVLARTFRDEGDAQAAWVYYDRYLATYLGRRERHAILLECVDMFFDANDPERAEQNGLQIWSEIHRFPDAGKTALRLVRAFRKHERVDAASRIAQDLCGGTTPEAQEGCLLLAQILEQAGDQANAIAAWQRTLEFEPLSRLNVRAYIALGKLLSEQNSLPRVPDALLGDRENGQWSSLMTEIARLAAGKSRHRDVIHALQNVPNIDDRASAQRSRLLLNAAKALADEEQDRRCEWLLTAVSARPVTSDHRGVMRLWITGCTSSDAGSVRESLIALGASNDARERELFMDAVRTTSAANLHSLTLDLLSLPVDMGIENAEPRARMFIKAATGMMSDEAHRQCHWLQTAVTARPFVVDHKSVVRAWLNECAPEYSHANLDLFKDIPQDPGMYSVEVMSELLRGWGTGHRELQTTLIALWDAPISHADRLSLAPHVVKLQLARKASRWSDDLLLVESSIWNELTAGFPQALFVGIFDLLDEYGKTDQAVDWLLNFAGHARGPGQARIRKALAHVFEKKETSRYDLLTDWYVRWYPAAKDLPEIASRQVELRAVGPELSDAWAFAETWLGRFDKQDALAFIRRIQPFFANRGSRYVEALNGYILATAENDEETFTAHKQLGDYYLKMMDYEKAALHMEQAFGLSMNMSDRDKMKVGTGLLKAVVEAGYPENYVRYLLAGIERIMDSMDNRALKAQTGHQLAKALERLGMLEEAFRIYRDVADLDQNNMSAKAALYNLAKSYANAGDDQNALATYMEYLQRYDSESDQRWYNIALANALSVAMKSADPAVIGELQMKAESLVNGVHDPFTLLDLAQYFGRQGHEGIQTLLMDRGLAEAKKQIDTATELEDRYKALELAVKRLFKMGYYNESMILGEKYYQLALDNNPETQNERLHLAQYEMMRAKLGTGHGFGSEVAQQASLLFDVARQNGFHNAAVKYLMLISSTSPNRAERVAAKEKLVADYPQSQPSFRAKTDLAAIAYANGDRERAKFLAADALAQASGEYQKSYAENIRYNVLYINAVLLEEEGRHDLAAPMRAEIETYIFKDSWIYVDKIMKGEKGGYY